MLRLIQSLFKPKQSPSIEVAEHSTITDPFSGMTIESLWNDFERRTYDYSFLKNHVGGDHQRLLNWVGSMDHSGYIREKCLRHLIENRVAGDENRILLRLADWVEPVRAIASEWVAGYFHELPLESILANQRLILYLTRKEKVQASESMRLMEDDLLSRTREMNIETFHQFGTPFRRFLLRLSLRRDQGLRNWVLSDMEPSNRSLLLEGNPVTDLSPDEIRILSNDRSVRVRRLFAGWMIDGGRLPTREFLMQLAFDSNRGIRQFARYHLMQIHGLEMYPVYRTCDNADFYLIADYARVKDSDIFVEGCRHASKRVRVDCLRALTVAAPERIRELDLGGLIRSSSGTRRLVCLSCARLLDTDQLMALKADIVASSANGVLVFLRMLEAKSFWMFLDAGLAFIEDAPPPHVSQYIRKRVHTKVSIHEKLPALLRDRISSTLERMRKSGSKGDEYFLNQIAFMLKHA